MIKVIDLVEMDLAFYCRRLRHASLCSSLHDNFQQLTDHFAPVTSLRHFSSPLDVSADASHHYVEIELVIAEIAQVCGPINVQV
jgi:hypothetical protein